MSFDFNEAFEFIFKNDFLDLFNFEPGILYLVALYGFTPPQ